MKLFEYIYKLPDLFYSHPAHAFKFWYKGGLYGFYEYETKGPDEVLERLAKSLYWTLFLLRHPRLAKIWAKIRSQRK